MKPDRKKGIMGIISLALGIGFSLAGLRILATIAPNFAAPDRSLWKVVDIAISALFISAGTEGFNSIMKFLSYQKETAKAGAAVSKAAAANTPASDKPGALTMVNR